MSEIRIGTCSWKYNSWQGIIYPLKEKFNYLREYSKHYNTVEIDQWFWSLHGLNKVSLPMQKDVKDYAASVPDKFRFTIKIPNSISLTHFYKKKKSDPLVKNSFFLNPDLFSDFLSTLIPFEKKIGVLMFQFEYLNKEKMSGVQEFTERIENFINKADRSYQYGIELRNPNYLNKIFFEFLQRNNLSMVFLQGYYMPPVWNIFKEYKDFIKNTVVIRLHGPDRSGIEEITGSDWSKIVQPKDEELPKIIEMIKYFRTKKIDAYINVNNHYEGSAPLTISKINSLLKSKV